MIREMNCAGIQGEYFGNRHFRRPRRRLRYNLRIYVASEDGRYAEVVGFAISGVDPWGSATRVLIFFIPLNAMRGI
jgi:hypothetical protein